MKRMRRVNRETVLQQMMELAAGAANDAVKLAYLTGEDREQISELDLGALTEFKRSSNGTVEVKLADRAAVLGRLLEQLKEEENAAPAAFLQALDQPDGGGPPAPVCSRR
ncbi:MAG: XRE family transcriptional regulator [Evtepia sp.]|uniref:XRE family transcriptional regulator n=1 Tax=Evtepia sp. TaxID=2773933 RepID=UPI002A80BF7E|nr:XRE family transcriptional regulator [Evtepia sp.]MDY3992567.1 XRE family transcriptional regulator [Evtepia sp.]MDY4430943.1 XRE family transcriptional regulator [Evtepia sp.]